MIEYENLSKANQPFFDAYRKRFNDVLESGWYILGESVKHFEQEFATWCGSNHCVGLASGLDALYLSLKAFDFPKDSEVIVPSNTYIATILSILQNQFTPVLVEPRLDTYNINPELIEQHITSKTKAIMVVHLYGKCCEMEPILQLAKKYNLKVIEDCAQAHGAMYKDQQIGTFGEFGAFSLSNKKSWMSRRWRCYYHQ